MQSIDVRSFDPLPFVRALIRPLFAVELLLLLWVMAMFTATMSGPGVELLISSLFGEAPPLPSIDRSRLYRVGLLQMVSVWGVSFGVFWSYHLIRTVHGRTAWTLPDLPTRLRAALALGMAIAAATTGAAVWSLGAPAEVVSFAALAAWWVTWPLLMARSTSWILRLPALAPLAVVYSPAAEVLAPGLPWMGLLLLMASTVTLWDGITTTHVRSLLEWLDQRQQSGHILADPEAVAEHGRPSAPANAREWRVLLEAYAPRMRFSLGLPSTLLHVLSVPMAMTSILFYVVGISPFILLTSMGMTYHAFGSCWLPVGRAEQLRLARRMSYSEMMRDGFTILATLGGLSLLRAPSLGWGGMTFDASGSYLTQVAFALAIAPILFEPSFPIPQPPSMRSRFGRALLGLVTMSVSLRLTGEAGWPLAPVFVTLLATSIAVHEWRLRRRYMRSDLQPQVPG